MIAKDVLQDISHELFLYKQERNSTHTRVVPHGRMHARTRARTHALRRAGYASWGKSPTAEAGPER
jgi:hypothetical protein